VTCGYLYEDGAVSISYAYEGVKRQAAFALRLYPSAIRWSGTHSIPFPSPDKFPWTKGEFSWSVIVSPDGAYAATASFGRFDKSLLDETLGEMRSHWAGIHIGLRGMTLGKMWSSYKGFAEWKDTPSPYSTGGREITYVTFKPAYSDPSWQGSSALIQASYADLTRETPLVKLACGETGLDGDPSYPFD
jgi:hypothetical protein